MNASLRMGSLALLAMTLVLTGCGTKSENDGPISIDFASIVGGDGAENEGVERGDLSEVYPDNTSSDLQLHWAVTMPSDHPQYTVSWFISDDLIVDDSDIEVSYSGCGSGFGNCPDDTGSVFCSFDTNDVLDCGPDVTSRHDLTSYFSAHGGVGRYYLIMEANDSISPDSDRRAFELDFF